jgi:hypothetical protein
VARYPIDANLPRWSSLGSGGDCEFVHDLGADWSDSAIWDYAAANGLTIVSKDADFSDRALLANAGGPKVIHVRVGPHRKLRWHARRAGGRGRRRSSLVYAAAVGLDFHGEVTVGYSICAGWDAFHADGRDFIPQGRHWIDRR